MADKKLIKVALIGFGSMGRGTAEALHNDPAWDLVAIADPFEKAREAAGEKYPGVRLEEDGLTVINDPEIDAVAITTLADVRPVMMSAALKAGKHIWAEKPIGESVEQEEALLEEISASGRHVAVNLFNRNAWYHERMLDFLHSGQIGHLVSVRTFHQTHGLLPESGHGPEGAPFHDCGMHYVDVARWYADSEYDRWDAQGVCMWGHDEPWHVDVHGTFENGVIFNITQGFIFGHEAKSPRTSCGLELIGSKGVIRMDHDFDVVKIDMRGTDETVQEEGPYGGKKLDVMASRLAEAINGGPVRYPTARDSVIASRVSWDMLKKASETAPRHGTHEDLERVKAYKATL